MTDELVSPARQKKYILLTSVITLLLLAATSFKHLLDYIQCHILDNKPILTGY